MFSPAPHFAYYFYGMKKLRENNNNANGTRHDTIIPNLSPLRIFSFFHLERICNVNCTRIIPFRERIWCKAIDLSRFRCGTHTTNSARIHRPMEVKNAHATCGTGPAFLSLSCSSAANLSRCQTSMDFAIAQWTLHPFEQFHLLLQLNFASSPKCSITACTRATVLVCECGCVSGRRCQMRQWYLHWNTIIIMWFVRRCHCLFMFHIIPQWMCVWACVCVFGFVCWKLFS